MPHLGGDNTNRGGRSCQLNVVLDDGAVTQKLRRSVETLGYSAGTAGISEHSIPAQRNGAGTAKSLKPEQQNMP